MTTVSITDLGPVSRLCIDGEVVHAQTALASLADGYDAFDPARLYNVQITNPTFYDRVCHIPLSEWGKQIADLQMGLIERELGGREIALNIDFHSTAASANIHLLPILDHWKAAWSPAEYAQEFVLMAKNVYAPAQDAKVSVVAVEGQLLRQSGITLIYPVPSLRMTLDDVITTLRPIVERVHEATVSMLLSRASSHAIVAQFDFPPDFATPCEQYLVYFVQFLKDSGVEATSDLTRNASHILFSVTPESKGVALERVRLALEAYLQLPSNPGISMGMVPTADPQTTQLLATIDHYRSQIGLRNATIQAQQGFIQSQQVTIQTQATLLAQWQPVGPDVVAKSLRTLTGGPTEEKVRLFGGAVILGKWGKGGVEFDWANMYRRTHDFFFLKQLPQPSDTDNTINE